MATYRIDLDLLEGAKLEYENAEKTIAEDIETARTVVNNLTPDIYSGEDADTFRTEFTNYINEDMTDALGNIRAIRTILENGLDDGKACKKLCSDFGIVLGGSGSGKSKEQTGGILYCDQDMIMGMKDTCREAVAYAESIRIGANSLDNILDDLRTVSLDSTTYTDTIRSGCDKIERLYDFSAQLTTYAMAVESMDDYLKTGLDNCAPSILPTVTQSQGYQTASEKKKIDEIELGQQVEAYWNRQDGYFSRDWWLDTDKKNEATQMLLYDSLLIKSGNTQPSMNQTWGSYSYMEIKTPKEQAVKITLQTLSEMKIDGTGPDNVKNVAKSEVADISGMKADEPQNWQEWLDDAVDGLMDSKVGDVLAGTQTLAYMYTPTTAQACQLYIMLSGKSREEAIKDIYEFSRGGSGGVVKVAGELFFGTLTIGGSIADLCELYEEHGLTEGTEIIFKGITEGIQKTWEEDIVNGDARSRGEVVARLEAEILLAIAGAKAAKAIKTPTAGRGVKEAAQEAGEAATDVSKVVKESAETAAKNAEKIVPDTTAKEIKKAVADVGESGKGVVEEGAEAALKGGSGSKFQEVFDLADNYTLSDDTFNSHILDRHGPNSTYGNKSHFNADFDIREGIDSTLRGDNFVVGPNTAGREGYIFEQTFTNPIGANSKGKPLYTLKVVIDEAGNVITAFPKK